MAHNRRAEIDHDHQGQLLTVVGPDDAAIAEETFPDQPGEKLLGRPSSYEVIYGPEGSWKDLEERAEELLATLGALSLRNQRVGFAVASNAHRHNGQIFGRYRARVPHIQDGAERNTSRYLDEAKQSFWAATGFAIIRQKGLANRQEIDAKARSWWEQFSGRYGTPIQEDDRFNPARPQYQKRLRGMLKNIQAIKQRRAADQALKPSKSTPEAA